MFNLELSRSEKPIFKNLKGLLSCPDFADDQKEIIQLNIISLQQTMMVRNGPETVGGGNVINDLQP